MRKYWSVVYVLALAILLVGCEKSKVLAKLFPSKIDGYKLEKVISGKKAMEMVNKLHGKKINAKAAWVAYYVSEKNPKEKVTVWVSEAPSAKEATNQVEVMMAKIEKKPMPFYHVMKMGDVYVFSGLGQRHAVFTRDKYVFWISGTDGSLRYFVHYYFRVKEK